MKEEYIREESPAITLTFSCSPVEKERLDWLMKKENRTRSNMVQQLINEKYFEYNPPKKESK